MKWSGAGSTAWRVFVIQLLVLVGILLFLKFYLPHRRQVSTQKAIQTREEKITALFHQSVEEDTEQEIAVPIDGTVVQRHPKRLRVFFGPEEIEATLGVPDSTTTDFRGGQHLTWLGTGHRLEASFESGRLYCLGLENRATGRGELVYESYPMWHPY